MNRWNYAARTLALLCLTFAAACGSSGGSGSEPADAPAAVEQPAEADAPASEAEAETEPEPAPAFEPEPAPDPEPETEPEAEAEPEGVPVEQPAEAEAEPADPAPEKAEPARHVVDIVDFAFSIERLEIKAGDAVVFVNKDAVAHTATAEDESFDTGLLKQGEEKEVTFAAAGEFPYICTPHPGMKAVIVVN